MATSPKRRVLRSFERHPAHAAALDRVRAWTRERFSLAEDAAILVSEVTCALPGCPPRETVVAFWTGNGQRHQFKLFKPVAEVVADDLPPAWLKNALFAIEGLGCECC
jgi:nitrate reductase delta subunit